MFQPRREQWTRQRYQMAPPESLRRRPQLEADKLIAKNPIVAPRGFVETAARSQKRAQVWWSTPYDVDNAFCTPRD